MKISAVRLLSVEAVEFSPASATEQYIRSGRKTMSSGTGGISPTGVVEPPLLTAGGGGGGGGGGGRSPMAVAEVPHRDTLDADDEENVIR